MVRKVSVVMVSVIALAVAACGHQRQDAVVDVDTAIDAHALAVSVDHTAQAATARVHLHLTTSVTAPEGSKVPGGGSFDLTGDGAYDTSAGLSSLLIDMGSALPGMTEEVIQHGDVTYLRVPILTTLAPSLAGKWLRVDRDQAATMGGASPSTGPLGGSSGVGDPSAVLSYLKGAGAEVTTVGHDEVGGVHTTHVHATISVRQAIDASGVDRDKVEQSLRRMPGMSKQIESLTLPVDVFVDNDGYVRRIAITYDATGVTMSLTLDYSAFGQPVSITEPDEADTADICDLYAGLPTHGLGSSLPAGVC